MASIPGKASETDLPVKGIGGSPITVTGKTVKEKNQWITGMLKKNRSILFYMDFVTNIKKQLQ